MDKEKGQWTRVKHKNEGKGKGYKGKLKTNVKDKG